MFKLIISLSVIVSITACVGHKEPQTMTFSNSEISYQSGLSDIGKMSKAYFTTQRKEAKPKQAIPLKPISIARIRESAHDQLIKLSHSSVLLYLDGEFILTDPVFSERASPVQWAGPKRFHPLPISLEDLPALKAVVISHDHYDHLDKATVLALQDKVAHFITPLQVGQHLIKWGIPQDKVIELDWWEHAQLGSHRFTATPAQHFSGRGLFDRDHSLWAGWAIKGQHSNIFFSGDSGYFSGFKEIGERLGPFDISLIETGAYNELWSEIHMTPEQSVQAHIDVQGVAMVPIHNSSFDLALHDWHEPLQRALTQAQLSQVHLLTPIFGEALNIHYPQASANWWQKTSEIESVTLVLEQ